MAGIHDAILEVVRAHFQSYFIDNEATTTYRAGYVGVGQVQGDPIDPDAARITITLHENDIDSFEDFAPTSLEGSWEDEEDLDSAEIGAITYIRRFTVRARCLFDTTGEDRDTAREIASTIRTRIEHQIRQVSMKTVNVDGEYISLPVYAITGEMVQLGGPPDSFDWFIKVRFALKTTLVTRPYTI